LTSEARLARLLELQTPQGLARVHLHAVDTPVAALVLGHGAGGGIESPDLVGATDAARSSGPSVALVEQPYRVAGRRSPVPASQLDAAWNAVVFQLRAGPFGAIPILTGGRSSGAARLACRTAAETDSVASSASRSRSTRPAAGEEPPLRARRRRCPTLVVQGESDPFGCRRTGPNRTIALIPGTHSLRNSATVAAAVLGNRSRRW
jgi:uncharacterized protein